MRKHVLLGLALAMPAGFAFGDIFKCVDGQGHVTYTNDSASSRGCTKLEEDLPVSSVPAVRPPPKSGGATVGFPKVSPADQKARDDGRRAILTRELEDEEKALADARRAFDEQDAVRLGDERNYQKKLDRLQPFKDQVELHQRNVEALRKEIGNLR